MPQVTEETKTIRKWLEENIDKYPNKKACFVAGAPQFNTTWKAIQNIWYARTKMQRRSGVSQTPQTVKKHVFLSDAEISQRHDVYYKIRNAAQKLKPGMYVEDSDFRDSIVCMSTSEYRRPSDNAEFDIYKGKAGGKTYWGHPESIKEKKLGGIFK